MKASGMGWALLAAAIVRSGQLAEDERFLKSDWCSTLTDIVSLSISRKGSDTHAYFTKKGGVSMPSNKGSIK